MFKSPVGLIPRSSHKNLKNLNYFKLKHQWVAPQGYDTGIQIYSRANRENVPFILPNKDFVKWYLCGPTVYDTSHIGHASCYVRFDLINRILKQFFGIHPVIALGITDIDDKIIKRSQRKKVDFRILAKQYELEFFNHLTELNVLPPSMILRVSDHIPEIIDFISKIIQKEKAYPTEEGSVYFDNVDFEDEEESKGPVSLKPGQRHHSHFALWKGYRPDEPYWEAPWGRGRPGWHIECSAMASKVFGPQLDIHGGGIDLVFPHHANEEIQSCAYHGCDQWVNYWIHTGELNLEEVKMSKSLNNFISISDFLKTYTADEFRMYCFISKYGKALHYGPDAMGLPKSVCEIVIKFLGDAASYVKGDWVRGNISESELLQELRNTDEEVRRSLRDNFDYGSCHLAFMTLIQKTMKMLAEDAPESHSRSPGAVAAVAQYIQNMYNSFGFHLGAVAKTSENEQKLEFILDQVVRFRDEVRKEALKSSEKSMKVSLLNACDSIRSDFASFGIIIKDQAVGKSSWSIVDTQKKQESENS